MQAVQVPGADGEHTQIPASPNPANRISGVSSQFQHIDNYLAIREGKKGTTGGNKTPKITNNLSKGTCNVHRESCSNLQSCQTSSTTLQSSTEDTQLSDSRKQLPGVLRQVRFLDNSDQRDDRGPELVVNSRQTDNGSTNLSLTTCDNHRIRCFTPEVGSEVWGHRYRGKLANTGSNTAHQLPGAFSCLSGPKNLYHKPNRYGPSENGQHLCSELYQLEGRYALSSTVQLSSGNMGMVSPETDIITSRAPTCTWHSQQGGRHGIQSNEGPV